MRKKAHPHSVPTPHSSQEFEYNFIQTRCSALASASKKLSKRSLLRAAFLLVKGFPDTGASHDQGSSSWYGKQNLLSSQLYTRAAQLYKKICVLSYCVSSKTLPWPEGKKRQEVSILNLSHGLLSQRFVLLGLQDRKCSYTKHRMKEFNKTQLEPLEVVSHLLLRTQAD